MLFMLVSNYKMYKAGKLTHRPLICGLINGETPPRGGGGGAPLGSLPRPPSAMV